MMLPLALHLFFYASYEVPLKSRERLAHQAHHHGFEMPASAESSKAKLRSQVRRTVAVSSSRQTAGTADKSRSPLQIYTKAMLATRLSHLEIIIVL